MTTFNLHSEIDQIHQKLGQEKQQDFRRYHAKRAKIIAEVLSPELIDALDICLEESGEFVFEYNARRYLLKSFNERSRNKPPSIEVDRDYRYAYVTDDEILLKYLAEDRDRTVQPKRPHSVGDHCLLSCENYSSGITLREYFIGKVLSRWWITPKRAIKLADEAISLLDAEFVSEQAEIKSYPFNEVLEWYEEPKESGEPSIDDIPF